MNSRHTKSALLALAIISLTSQAALADSVENAYRFCSALDSTGLLSQPCKVSGWNQAIDATIDTSSSEARKICAGIVAQASQIGARFDKGWKVRIYSPYSNGNTIAQCSF